MPRVPEGSRLVLVNEELFDLFGARTLSGKQLSYAWGEQKPGGWFEPVATETDDRSSARFMGQVNEADLAQAIGDYVRRRDDKCGEPAPCQHDKSLASAMMNHVNSVLFKESGLIGLSREDARD